MSNDSQAKLTVDGFDGAGAVTNIAFPISAICEAFHKQLRSEWAKRARKLTLTQPVTITGNFVRVDQGNRFLRYMLLSLVGNPAVEVEGHFALGDRTLGDFHLRRTHMFRGFGFFGGNSKGMTRFCAENAASDIVKMIVSKLR